MKINFLKFGIYFSGLVALCLSIVIRFDYNWQKEWILDKDIIYDTDTYGDLYQINLIDNFRIPIEPRIEQYQFSNKHPSIDEADILIFGDSFLDHPRQRGIPELISDSTGLKVFYESHYLSPLYMVNLIGAKKDSKRRIMVIEVVERYLTTIDDTEPILNSQNDMPDSILHESPISDLAIKGFNNILHFIFPKNPDKNYEFIIKRSKYLYRVGTFINTIQFNFFGYINNLTPIYSLDPPFLFYHETVDNSKYSYFHFHSDEEIKDTVGKIKKIQEYLSLNYNLEFILLPVPNKMTLYHDLVTEIPYDAFLPRLINELENQGIPVINIYKDFNDSQSILYYATDTHLNTHGMNKVYQKVMDELMKSYDFESIY